MLLQHSTQQWESDCKKEWQYSHIQHAAACDPIARHTIIWLLHKCQKHQHVDNTMVQVRTLVKSFIRHNPPAV
jgi:hypothetical protein